MGVSDEGIWIVMSAKLDALESAIPVNATDLTPCDC